MLTIKITRLDLFPYCRNISIANLTFREVDPKKVSAREFSKADFVYFEDGEERKVLKDDA